MVWEGLVDDDQGAALPAQAAEGFLRAEGQHHPGATGHGVHNAHRLAADFAEYLTLRRNDFVGRFVGVEEAIEQALAADGPVCLLDMGDNVGGGSPGDGTLLLHALVRRQVAKAFVSLCDPVSVQKAARAGVGQHVALEMGGKVDALHGEPLACTVRVRGMYDGRFSDDRIGIFIPATGDQVSTAERLLREAGAVSVEVQHA